MTKYTFIPGVLSFILFSFVVLSAQPSQAQTPNTGLNIGIALSGNWVDFDVSEIDNTVAPPIEEEGQAGFDEFGVTLAVGYNRMFGPVIAGIIADITLADFSDRYSGNKYSSDYIATLRAQIGFMIRPGVMAYLTGGLAWMDASYNGFAMPPAVASSAKDNSVLNGWVIGIGGEVNTGIDLGTGPVMVRAEYLYGEFEEWKFSKWAELYKIDPTMNIVRIGFVVPLGIGAGN